MTERVEMGRGEACRQFAVVTNMFIRGVDPDDAERLWDHAERLGVPGTMALRDAIIRGETPDEWIERVGDTAPKDLLYADGALRSLRAQDQPDESPEAPVLK